MTPGGITVPGPAVSEAPAGLAFAVLDQLEAGVAVLDHAGCVVLWNGWMQRASGLAADAMRGRNLLEALGAAASGRLRQAVEEALDLSASALLSYNLNVGTLPLRLRDGTPLIHATAVRPMMVDGQVGCLIQVTDVTRTVERERLVRERRDARFRALVDAASDAIVSTDTAGRILWANDEATRRFGRPKEAMEGQSIALLLGDGASAWTDPGVRTVEVEAVGADGQTMPMELSLARWLSDERIFVTGFLRDISERRRAEAEIADRHAEMAQLAAQTRMTLDALPAGVMVLDDAGRILFVNQTWTALGDAGLLPEGGRAVGGDYLAAVAAAGPAFPDSEHVRARLQALLRGEVPSFSLDAAVSLPEGTRRFSCIGASIAGGPMGRLVFMLQDITEPKRLEEELRDLNTTLEARVEAEIAARERAQEMARHAEQMRTLGQLAGGMAHDFNNVLQAILGSAKLLSNRLDRPDIARKLIGVITTASERGAAITGRLLSFAHRGELSADHVDLAALLRDLSIVLSHTLGSGVMVEVRAEPGLPAALADKVQLETVLINLATNARDAMPDGGLLLIALEEAHFGDPGDAGVAMPGLKMIPGRYLCITVSDTGGGMDEAVLARVAEPFFTTKPVGRGTGLGLAMARGFADQSGGALRISSVLGVGTTVRLWLPAASAAGQPALAAAPIVTAPAGWRHARVLLVDDEAAIRETVRAGLEDLGFGVVAVPGGHEALRHLAGNERTDVLVTDLAMAEMDGMTLIRRAREGHPGLPVILLTGFAEASPAAVAEAGAGSFHMLRKPASAEQIAASITALVPGEPRPIP